MIKYIQFINEGKIQNLQKKYDGKLTEFEIDNLKDYANNSSANFEWLLKHYTNDKNNYEENMAGVNILLDLLDDYFKRFLRIKNSLPNNNRDINNIKNTNHLIEIVDEHNDFDKINDDKDVDVIINNQEWIVFQTKSYKASKKWGWSRFCSVNDENSYYFYNVNNIALTYIIHKFDYTKHHTLQTYPEHYYKLWDYQDDNFTGNGYSIYHQLYKIDDNNLLGDINDIINYSYIDLDDYKTYYAKYLVEKYDIYDVYTFLNINNDDISEEDNTKVDYEFALEYINDMDNEEFFNEFLDNLRDSI